MTDPANYLIHWIPGRFLSFLTIESPAKLAGTAFQAIYDVAPQAIDLVHVGKLLWAQSHNFPGFEVAVVQQEGQSPFAFAGEHRAYDPQSSLSSSGSTTGSPAKPGSGRGTSLARA